MDLRSPHRNSGFTLLELIVVLFLISLIAGIAVVSFAGTFSSGTLDAAARSLVAAMKQARMQSSVSGEPQAVFIDLDAGSYGLDGKGSRAFSRGLSVSFVDPLAGRQTRGRHRIEFDPIGGIRGGTVLLQTQKRTVSVRPDPLVAAVAENVEGSR
ncbi:MAG: type II secretion system protein GspH [Nitrospirae bacterium]|nr:type II secretion system protein GspH [Nitrospirota bacterium]